MRQASTGMALLLLIALTGIVYVPTAQTSSPAKSELTEQSASGRPGHDANRECSLGDTGCLLRQICSDEHPCNVETLIATVPDPLDSRAGWTFDRNVDAIQRALERSGYILDRSLLPWSDTRAAETRCADIKADDREACLNAKARMHRYVPGILVLRDDAAFPATPNVLVLFLVGETPTSGIQAEALNSTLRSLEWLRHGEHRNLTYLGPEKPIRVLGPSFSGSARSLRLAFDSWGIGPAGDKLTVISGSATAGTNKTYLGDSFSATMIPDEVLMHETYAYLSGLGVDQSRVVLMTESNTAYGRESTRINKDDSRSVDCPGGGVCWTRVPFPLHISQVRSAFANADQNQKGGSNDLIKLPREALELSLDASSEPRDIVPALAPRITGPVDQLALATAISALAHDRVEYIGIVATDPLDKLFLARMVRTYAPNARLFTFGSDLLYTHPDYLPYMRGALVASTYPLYNDDAGAGQDKTVLQFPDEDSEGIFNATLALLESSHRGVSRFMADYGATDDPTCAGPHPDPTCTKPPVWISAVGSAGIRPLHHSADYLVGDNYVYRRTGVSAPSAISGCLPILWLAVYVFVVFALFATAIMVIIGQRRRAPVPPPLAVHSDGVSEWRARAAKAVCAVRDALIGDPKWLSEAIDAGVFVAAVDVLTVGARDRNGVERSICVLSLLATELFVLWYLSYMFLVGAATLGAATISLVSALATARALTACVEPATVVSTWMWAWWAPRREQRSAAVASVGQPGGLAPTILVIVGPLTIVANAAFSFRLFSADASLFERGAYLGSGLSPAVPVLLIATGVAGYFIFRLRALRLADTYAVENPLAQGTGPSATGIKKAGEIILAGLVGWEPTAVAAVSVAATGCFIWLSVPGFLATFEGQHWGVLFKIAVALMSVAIVSAFVRFCGVAYHLRRLLRRLAAHPMVDAYDRLPPKFSAKLRSRFYAYLPSVSELELPLERLRQLAASAPANVISAQLLPEAIKHTARLYARDSRRAPERGWIPVREGSPTQRYLARLAGTFVHAHLSQYWNKGSRVQRAAAGAPKSFEERAEDFVAFQVATYLGYLFSHLWNLATFVVLAAVLMLLTFSSYPFQGEQLLISIDWVLVVVFAIAMAAVVFQMDRSELLTCLGNPEAKTNPSTFNRVTVDRNLVAMLLTYVFVPVLALLATQFPRMGGIFHVIDPLLRGLK